MQNDLSFEAESFFGADQTAWPKHAEELLLNFEEDLVSEELIETMQELKLIEQKNPGPAVAELVKKCQALSLRKAEIGRRRKI
jgi:hypothetical protein